MSDKIFWGEEKPLKRYFFSPNSNFKSFDSSSEEKMRPGEQFEINCCNYLNNNYKTPKIRFCREGGMDSTKSDIAVIKNGRTDFYIEVKDALAQSGQFVLLPDEYSRSFIFSPRNRSQPNEMTDIIINYMNSDFDLFSNAGTAGESIDIDSDVFADWIVKHYKSKNVKYIISGYNDYVILPIGKFSKYFNIKAQYRKKKSGSGDPPKKTVAAVKHIIEDNYATAIFSQDGSKLFADISEPVQNDRFTLGRYTYYLSNQYGTHYRVRKLSNTQNMNVIFSIKLIHDQGEKNLEAFKAELS